MEPITAFALAAGVLQVVDFSFKALSKCRELYADGSLAEHKSTKETTKDLGKSVTIDQLRASVNESSKPRSQDDQDLLDISVKSSQTARELLEELNRLQPDSKGSFRQALSKSLRALQREKFVRKIQQKLEDHRRILNTRILVRLNAHSVELLKVLPSLSQDVQKLVVALAQGQNTVEKLLTDQGQALQNHFDQLNRRLDDQARTNRQQKLKDSLFFPEINSRQEQIPDAHKGTCRWIFNPYNAQSGSSSEIDLDYLSLGETQSEQLDESDSEAQEGHDDDASGEGDTYRQGPIKGSNEVLPRSPDNNIKKPQSQSWSDFVDWLEHGEGVYWVNGKAGSGKSTLMNYISTERRTEEALTVWANGSVLLMPSFFFWNPGSPLQKSSQGLLRSLLYQIADLRPDMVSVMMGREEESTEAPNELLQSAQMHAWTEKRLFSVLHRFLDHKPRSISICFFIDGLDEFVGEQNILIETVRLIMETPRAKVCLSSRSEQIFREEFRDSPQLKLQDLNFRDMQKMASDKLTPALKKYLPQAEEEEVNDLIWEITRRAEGVFLWLDIMIKDIIYGARNRDTMEELRSRLQTTPDTIEGLYEHMLNKLDKLYWDEAAKYFRRLVMHQEGEVQGRQLTLVDFACAEDSSWEHVLRNDLEYFTSSEFRDVCDSMETRILTRCAGLVEIGKTPPTFLVQVRTSNCNGGTDGTSLGENQICHYIRDVNFIHRTVLEFLKSHRQAFFEYPSWRSAAAVALARGQLGFMNIVPIAISEKHDGGKVVTVAELITTVMHTISTSPRHEAAKESHRALDNDTIAMVDQAYQITSNIDANLNGPNLPWYERYSLEFFMIYRDKVPFYDSTGFAAFFGCDKSVWHYILSHACSPQYLNYLLVCTLVGAGSLYSPYRLAEGYPHFCASVEGLLREGADPNCSLNLSLPGLYLDLSAWSWFLSRETRLFNSNSQGRLEQYLPHRYALIKSFLSHNAHPNEGILSSWDGGGIREAGTFDLHMRESALAYLERYIPPKAPHFWKELFDMLRSQGALLRRRCCVIQVFHSEVSSIDSYHVSQDQSDRLLEALPWEWDDSRGQLCPEKEALRCAVEELVARLTEADKLDEPIILRSSWESQDVEMCSPAPLPRGIEDSSSQGRISPERSEAAVSVLE